MEIKLLKLVSGEEIISEIETIESEIILTDPLMVVIAPQGIAFMPWIMLTKETTISIAKNTVICILEVNEETENIYKKQTGKGVVTPGGLVT